MKAFRWTSFGLFACIIFQTEAFAAQSPLRPWLIKVSSEYLDEKLGTSQVVEGSGVLVSAFFYYGQLVTDPQPQEVYEQRYFVLTAAHVAQGDKLELRSESGTRLIPSGLLHDALNDVSIFEVPVSEEISPLAVYDNRFFLVTKALSEHQQKSQKLVSFIDYSYYVPAGTWVRTTSVRPSSLINYTVAQDQKYAEVSLDPGLSGAPLIENYFLRGEKFAPISVIGGLASRTSRALHMAYFSTQRQLERVFLRFLAQGRGYFGGTRWRLRQGLTYQDLGEGTLEINPVIVATGNGTSHDTGNGTSHDTGNGVTHDTGNAEIAALDPWQKYGIEAGMRYRGEAILGFNVDTAGCLPAIGKMAKIYGQAKNSNSLYPIPQRLSLWASVSTLRLLKERGECLKVLSTIATSGSRLGEQLKQKLGIKKNAFELVSEKITDFMRPAHAYQKLKYRDGKIEIEFYDYRHKEKIQFSLDTRMLAQKFRPEIQVKGAQSGKTYYIDITGLFFLVPDAAQFGGGPVPVLLTESGSFRALKDPDFGTNPRKAFFRSYLDTETMASSSSRGDFSLAVFLMNTARPTLIYRSDDYGNRTLQFWRSDR